MGRVVFDIETISKDFDELPEELRQYFLKDSITEEEVSKAKQTAEFAHITAEIVAICMINPESKRGECYYQNPLRDNPYESEDGLIKFYPCSEPEILQGFWERVNRYDSFVTFNGRGYDCPIILIRSAFHKIKPTRDLMPYRFDTVKGHIDLMDQLTFYGAIRRYSLEAWCLTFGITNPKKNGISGKDVKTLFKTGCYDEIAEYCVGDVVATCELLSVWENYMRFTAG